MIELWYALVGLMLIGYVVLDGRNFGVGMLHWLVAKTPAERRQVVETVRPFYSADEVWLVSFGGTLFSIFPEVLASAFSGYYLALFLILWCLILRGGSLELGGHSSDRMWRGFWDFVLVFASFLLALLFGVAAGNLARGVPLDEHGNFAMAFFTDFGVRGKVGLLDWYTVSVGLFAVVNLAAHGATYLTWKTEGAVHDRSAAYAGKLWLALCPLGVIITMETWYVRPDLFNHALGNPLSWLGVLIVGGSILTLVHGLHRRLEYQAFLGSTFFIVGMLGTGGATLFPVLLNSTLAPENSLTAYATASSPGTLWMALIWWPFALALAVSYSLFVWRRYAGKVSATEPNPGDH